MITAVGELCQVADKALSLNSRIKTEFERLKPVSIKKVAYLIWKEPWMAVAGDNYINDMIQRLGWLNVFASNDSSRYPEISLEELDKWDLDVLLLPNEPFPFTVKHQKELLQRFPELQILLVDGEMFSWYGSRMALAPAYFESMRRQV